MSDFQSLYTLKEIEQFIAQHPLAFLYITTPNCSVCQGLRPQIEQILTMYPRIESRTVDASQVTETAGAFHIFTAPVLLLFVEGKEYIREARIVHTEAFEQKIAKIYENMVD